MPKKVTNTRPQHRSTTKAVSFDPKSRRDFIRGFKHKAERKAKKVFIPRQQAPVKSTTKVLSKPENKPDLLPSEQIETEFDDVIVFHESLDH
jgi:hypothetical protein